MSVSHRARCDVCRPLPEISPPGGISTCLQVAAEISIKGVPYG